MTEPSTRKLLLVVAEAALERLLVDEIRAAGASGYTISDVRGAGVTGERDGSWEPAKSIEIRVITTADVAERLSHGIISRYGENYGVVVFVAEGTVVRPELF